MTSGMPDPLVQRLREKQQDHVLKFYEAGALDADQTAALTQQLEALDLDLLESIFQASTTVHPATANTTATVEPLDEVDLLANCSDADRQRWQDRGLEAIASGHVCALVMAGGQGTRLGFAGPKGLYDIGLPSEKSLFQLFAERVLKVQTLAAAAFPSASGDTTTTPLPLFVMTSLMNHDETVAYFRTHAFFGLEESQVFFFSQGTLPCFTMDGKLMLENAATLATASDGNGGIYKALAQSGGLDRLTERGVQYLHVFSVDNALCKVADPVFIGYCIDKRADCGNKVVWKSRADESVGVVAKKDGQYCVVEYSEMDAEACARTDPITGKLVFGAANICNHFFTTEFLKTVVLPQLSLAYHVAQKKIPIADENGETYTPTVTSGVKLEAFIFDTFPLSSRMAVLAVPRETEFAPVKNAPGSAVDSPDTARQMIVDEATAWLVASAEATLSKEEAEQFRTQKLEAASMIEISPLVSFNGEGLESYVAALHDAPSQTVLRLESVDIPASRSSIPPSIRERFENADQHHIFQFADQGVISAHEACALVEDIRALDPAALNHLFQRSTTTADADAHSQPVEIEPLGDDVVDLLASTPEEVRAEWMKRGLDAVAKGTVAALVLAGGQGTRLGFAGPKGMFDIGLPSHKSLFEIFALRVRKVQQLAQAAYHLAETPRLPFLVMTSEMNHDTTVEFFKSHDYFGLDADQVRFFRQGTLPSFTLNGKLMLETKSSISRASDGNGGVYPALKRSRVLDHLENTCVQYLHVFSVDNILCKVADPVFIGYCVAHDADCANKVVWKDRPDESVGVFATKNGTFCVVEYSELDTASSERINSTTAKLAFGAANICNHFYRLDFLKKCCGLDASAAYHVAKKKIPYVDAAGTTIVPTTVSGIKLETFIFDVFQHATNMKVLGVERNDEFAPVKNASGASSDSPDTARHLVSQQCMRWLLQAGATFDERSNGLCEILPTVSYNGEGLEAIAKALSPIHLPVLIDEETESA